MIPILLSRGHYLNPTIPNETNIETSNSRIFPRVKCFVFLDFYKKPVSFGKFRWFKYHPAVGVLFEHTCYKFRSLHHAVSHHDDFMLIRRLSCDEVMWLSYVLSINVLNILNKVLNLLNELVNRIE